MGDLEELSNIARERGIDVGGTIGVTHDESWDNAPEWAKWKAQDGDGTWCWFSTKPKWGDWGLYAKGTWTNGKGKKEHIKTGGSHYLTRPNPNSKKTLEKRPPKYKLPNHDETMKALNKLKIR